MKNKMFFTVVALVLLFTCAFNIKAQVGFNELDPNILWVADSAIGQVDGFAVHPNGNIFCNRVRKIFTKKVKQIRIKFIQKKKRLNSNWDQNKSKRR